jgi:hypothetical protein
MVVDCRALTLSQNTEQIDKYICYMQGGEYEVSGDKDKSLHEVRVVLNRASWLKL